VPGIRARHSCLAPIWALMGSHSCLAPIRARVPGTDSGTNAFAAKPQELAGLEPYVPGTDSGTRAFAAKPPALAGLEAGFGMAGLIGGPARPSPAARR
jgi:hypothetical protein